VNTTTQRHIHFIDITRLAGWFWLASGTLGLGGTAVVWFLLPRERNVTNPFEFAAKLIVYILLILAAATFPRQQGRWTWLSALPFLMFTGYIIPRISYYYYFDRDQSQAEEFYTHLYLLLYPGIILTTAFALRLGGGTAGRVMKIALMGVLIIFSGFLDIMWQLVNPLEQISEHIDAPHITVITGREITFTETIWFTIAHIPLVALIAILPLQRWMAFFDDPDRSDGSSISTAQHTQPELQAQHDAPSQALLSDDPRTSTERLPVGLSIVAPAYNEAIQIGQVIKDWAQFLDSCEWVNDWEIVICNDGSNDDTAQVLTDTGRSVPRLRIVEHDVNRGAGAAIATGLRASTKQWVLVTDSDGQFPPVNLDRCRPLLADGAQAISGCRVIKQDTWFRRLGSRMSGMACNHYHDTSYRDFNSIFKLIPGEIARSMQLESRGLSCSTEIMSNLIQRGITWTEVEIDHLPREKGRSSWRFIDGARDRFLFIRYLATKIKLIKLGILRSPNEVIV